MRGGRPERRCTISEVPSVLRGAGSPGIHVGGEGTGFVNGQASRTAYAEYFNRGERAAEAVLETQPEETQQVEFTAVYVLSGVRCAIGHDHIRNELRDQRNPVSKYDVQPDPRGR